MWANMRIIVLLNALKVGSLRTRQMLKVDLCTNGAGAYAPYAPPPPLPTGLYRVRYNTTCCLLVNLVNQTVFRERACARERGRGGRKNTV